MTRIDIQRPPQVTATQISPSACQGGPTLPARSQSSLSLFGVIVIVIITTKIVKITKMVLGYFPDWSEYGPTSQSDWKPGGTMMIMSSDGDDDYYDYFDHMMMMMTMIALIRC